MIHYFTVQGQYTVEAAADPGYYTGQYQHHQAQDFYSQVRVVLSLSSLGNSTESLKRQQFNECAYMFPVLRGAAGHAGWRH